ncbi:uncharacterized protein LOC108741614 isoform X2 [Agrilus planipennis]|uniref:Uncharacterized protein LOC108741614 isoform X2 n=1 Tax=Agrilus planipennis TaxID=224129 RepID=A0A1W4XHX5_AGRPL|nr:uncharacterized protein LOC108741614 isoform X2 [Agrilus planipennis]
MFKAIIFLLLEESFYHCYQLQNDHSVSSQTTTVSAINTTIYSNLNLSYLDATLDATSMTNTDSNTTFSSEEDYNTTALVEATSPIDFIPRQEEEINEETAPVYLTPIFNSFNATGLIKSNTNGTRNVQNLKGFTFKEIQKTSQKEHGSEYNNETALCSTCTHEVTLFTSLESENTPVQLKVKPISPYKSSTSTKNLKKLHSTIPSDAQWPVKKEALVEGDIIVGGLMMIHEREDTVVCGPIMPQGGIQALETMLYTLDVINNPLNSILPNITLGAHILDDCDKDTYGLEMAVDFIKALGL